MCSGCRSGFRLRLSQSRRISAEARRGRLRSTEDDFPEEEEGGAGEPGRAAPGEQRHPAVDRAVRDAVATQMQAAVPYTPSTPSVTSSPVSSATSGGKESVPISPLDLDAPAQKPAQKPQSLSLRNPLLSARGPITSGSSSSSLEGAKESTRSAKGVFPIQRRTEIKSAAEGAAAAPSRVQNPVQRRSLDSPRGLRERVNSATEAVDELTTLTSRLSLGSGPLDQSHPVQR